MVPDYIRMFSSRYVMFSDHITLPLPYPSYPHLSWHSPFHSPVFASAFVPCETQTWFYVSVYSLESTNGGGWHNFFSESDLIWWMWWPLIMSVFLQMTQFCCSLWLIEIPYIAFWMHVHVCVCMCTCMYVNVCVRGAGMHTIPKPQLLFTLFTEADTFRLT